MRDIAEVMGTLKEIRKQKNVSVANVAEYLQKETGNQVSTKTIYGWEEGTSKPDIMSFVAMCNLYGVEDIRALFNGTRVGAGLELKDALYKAYISKPGIQEATRILLGIN